MTDDDPAELRTPSVLRWDDLQDEYGVALLLLLAGMVLPVFINDSNVTSAAISGMACAAALVALHASHVRPWLFRTALGATTLVIISLAIDDLTPGGDLSGVYYLAVGFLLLTTPVAILARIAHHEVITARTLYGVLCVYLLIGISFSFFFQAIEGVDPAAFNGITAPDRITFTYFSFITMTTVGYGDIVPVSDATRAMATLEAVLGQVFLVVIVARVVSLLGRERTPTGGRLLDRIHQQDDDSSAETGDEPEA